MRKLLNWFDNHLLKIGVSLILITVIVYPKFPIVDIPNTWVYIRLEDFLIAAVFLLWIIQFLRRKVSLKTPLTKPILAYFLAGGISTAWAIVFHDPKTEFFPNLALLHWLRRIEYMAVFFFVYSTVSSWQVFKDYLTVIFTSAFGVCLYGLGQRYFNLPAFSTMNEEFAKGIPLYLMEHSRVLSTFAGHYDFAAFLVLVITVFGSLSFVISKKRYRFSFIGFCLLSFYLLLLTFSRVSFGAYLLTIVILILLQRIKWLPKIAILIIVVSLSIISVQKTEDFNDRFSKMIAFNSEFFSSLSLFGKKLPTATSSSELLPFSDIVPQPKVATSVAQIYEEPGTGILPPQVIGPVATPTKRPRPLKITPIPVVTAPEKEKTIYVDRSTSTRFDAEWPRAIKAFLRNPILGSGYSSITLATDNDYLRLLGETGLAGFLTFMWIFYQLFKFIKSEIKRKIRNNFTWGIVIALINVNLGMLANAFLIDVFEASKVAISFWALLGLLLSFFKIKQILIKTR